MLFRLASDPISLILAFIGLIVAITIHEFAHAFVADKLGDPTPRYQGRVTLNPLAHLDPIGTIAILITSFGWGKPVEFDPYNLDDPVRDTALIALAGPASNIILASFLAGIYHWGVFGEIGSAILTFIVTINVVLAVFNLVPIHPLDGSKIILPILPKQLALDYEQMMQRYGMILLLLFIIPLGGVSPASRVIGPAINLIVNLLLG